MSLIDPPSGTDQGRVVAHVGAGEQLHVGVGGSLPASALTRTGLQAYRTPQGGAAQSLAWSPHGSTLAVTIFEPPAGAQGITDIGGAYLLTPGAAGLQELSDITPALATDGLAWAADGRLLAVLEPHGVAVVDTWTRERIATLAGAGILVSVAWSSTGQLAVAAAEPEGGVVFVYKPYEEEFTGPEPDHRVVTWVGHRFHPSVRGRTQVASIGWSDQGVLATLLVDDEDHLHLAVWTEDAGFSPLGDLARDGWILRPVLAQAWSRSGELAVVVQPITGDGGEREIAEFSELILWRPGGEPRTKRFDLGPFGLSGATWSPGDRWITCCTGEEILAIDAVTLSVVNRLSSVTPEPVRPWLLAGDPDAADDEIELTDEGMTVRHSWSRDGRWLAAGNVGAVVLWDALRLGIQAGSADSGPIRRGRQWF